jgi:hypothetical protein
VEEVGPVEIFGLVVPEWVMIYSVQEFLPAVELY